MRDCGLPISCRKEVAIFARSEEHTSELQSQSNLVCRLLLEKKKRELPLCVPLRPPVTASITDAQRDLACVYNDLLLHTTERLECDVHLEPSLAEPLAAAQR